MRALVAEGSGGSVVCGGLVTISQTSVPGSSRLDRAVMTQRQVACQVADGGWLAAGVAFDGEQELMLGGGVRSASRALVSLQRRNFRKLARNASRLS